jgi:3-dehydroquinate dehydratase/shikimate dehydrogenase
MTLICVPIQAKTKQELKRKMRASAAGADALEIWVDHLPPDISAFEIRKMTRKTLIIVNKPKREKGKWKGTEAERIKRLMEFAREGGDYVDVDITTTVELIRKLINNKKKAKIIISYHNYNQTPSERILWDIIKKAVQLGADIVKIVTYANRPEDNIAVFNILTEAKQRRLKVAAMCMGKYGKISRMYGSQLGSKLTFTALNPRQKTAPGQLTLDEYKEFTSYLNK